MILFKIDSFSCIELHMINSAFFYNNVAKQLWKPTKCLVHEFKIHMEHIFKLGMCFWELSQKNKKKINLNES